MAMTTYKKDTSIMILDRPSLRYQNSGIDVRSECFYTHHTCLSASQIPIHRHTFYEIFFITEGIVYHNVNEKEFKLTKGDFVFIRPADEHCFNVKNNETGHLINFEIPEHVIKDTSRFLGSAFRLSHLTDAKYSPVKHCNSLQIKVFEGYFKELATIPISDFALKKMYVRSLLAFIIVNLFFGQTNVIQDDDAPPWLNSLLIKMAELPNFSKGFNAMLELSGKSSAHLCRAIQKHKGTTPSTLINELRLNYAVNCLLHSDAKIIWIAHMAGFKNMSHFYTLFVKKFGLTPAQLRKQLLLTRDDRDDY